jgi:hypothetical protein
MKNGMFKIILPLFLACTSLFANAQWRAVPEISRDSIKTVPSKKTKEQALAENKKLYAESERIAKEWTENTELIWKSRINPNLAMASYKFDTEKYNFKRFQESPCWKKLGFNPMEEIKYQEEMYKKCEQEHKKKRIFKYSAISGLSLLMIAFVIWGVNKSFSKRNLF